MPPMVYESNLDIQKQTWYFRDRRRDYKEEEDFETNAGWVRYCRLGDGCEVEIMHFGATK